MTRSWIKLNNRPWIFLLLSHSISKLVWNEQLNQSETPSRISLSECLSISNNILLYVPIKILQAHNVYKTLVYIVIKWNLKIIWMSPLMLYELIWLLKGFVVQGKIQVSTRNYPVHLLYRIMLVRVLEFSTDAEIKTIKCGKQDNFTI